MLHLDIMSIHSLVFLPGSGFLVEVPVFFLLEFAEFANLSLLISVLFKMSSPVSVVLEV